MTWLSSINLAIKLACCLFCLIASGSVSSALAQSEPAQRQDLEVLRVNTELVQSPVMIFDKQGHFVDGLQRDQFELRVDGHPQAITFFDRVTAGTPGEALKFDPARKSLPATGTSTVAVSKGSVYGRTLIFFVDDLHLSPEGINRTRAALQKFIDESMGQNDRALITTGSGQLGFLQQLTDNKDVLRAAAERLKPRQFMTSDDERPPMGPYQALSIALNNAEVLKYYVELYFADYAQNMNKGGGDFTGKTPMDKAAADQMRGETGRRVAEIHIRARARNILNQYTSVTASSFASLRYLMSSSQELPGNKLIFVISDGFYLNRNVAGESQKLREVTSAAQRAGAVIYSIQASGLASSYPDAKTDLRQGHRMPMNLPRSGSDQELQAPLYTLAVDTGGRALFNSNSMDGSIRQALSETSEYYLLAWRPETPEQRSESFKEIQVSIKGRPELTVRVHKGYLTAAPKTPAETAPKSVASSTSLSHGATTENASVNSAKQVDVKVSEALSALYPLPNLPTSVNVRYSDVPNQGPQLMVATEISSGTLFRATTDDKRARTVDLMGVVLNDQGKTVASFKGQLKAEPPSGTANTSVSQTTELKVKPGLYQVRVAALDEKSGLIGSASQWISVPDLTQTGIALSSVFLGDRKQQTDLASKIPLSISHHFTADSRLRFFASIYNVARGKDGSGKPDVTIQMRILRDDRAIITGPMDSAATDGAEDLRRIPYAAEISLRTLPAGSYALQLTATDNSTKSSATQRVKFVVE
jgi:VWFA-related protein